MKFDAITFLPDGKIWDRGNYLTAEQDRNLVKAFSPCVTYDNKKLVAEIQSQIGTLKLDWVGSDQIGVGSSTWWLGEKIINTGVCLFGNNEEEIDILNSYLKVWREAEFVKELCEGRIPFTEVHDIQDRPLLISVNWASIKQERYDKVANFDLSLAAAFFEGMQAIKQVS